MVKQCLNLECSSFGAVCCSHNLARSVNYIGYWQCKTGTVIRNVNEVWPEYELNYKGKNYYYREIVPQDCTRSNGNILYNTYGMWGKELFREGWCFCTLFELMITCIVCS